MYMIRIMWLQGEVTSGEYGPLHRGQDATSGSDCKAFDECRTVASLERHIDDSWHDEHGNHVDGPSGHGAELRGNPAAMEMAHVVHVRHAEYQEQQMRHNGMRCTAPDLHVHRNPG